MTVPVRIAMGTCGPDFDGDQEAIMLPPIDAVRPTTKPRAALGSAALPLNAGNHAATRIAMTAPVDVP
jgi:hypothetical protein